MKSDKCFITDLEKSGDNDLSVGTLSSATEGKQVNKKSVYEHLFYYREEWRQ